MQTENLKCFFVWYVMTCRHYLYYCGIFLTRFLIKIILDIISSLHVVFSLCARVGWRDVCTDFTYLIKVDVAVDVNAMSLLKI